MTPRPLNPQHLRPGFEKTQWRNGLTVISERTPGLRGLSIGVWVKTGTRHERTKEVGISHFLEHMLFKGTESRTASDITKSIEKLGGEFNAFTNREHTCFHVQLRKQDLNLASEILSDIILHSTFDAVELERERKVILQEIAMVEDNPEELAHDYFYELAFGKHGLGRPILGKESSLRNLRRSDLLRYFRKHYRPDNMIISVAGDVSHDRVLEAFKSLERKIWPGRPLKRLSTLEEGFEPAPSLKNGFWWVKRPTEQAHVIWGVESPRATGRDATAAEVLSAYLGGGMSSVLFQEIREKYALAYSVYSSVQAFQDSGVCMIYVGCSRKQIGTVIKIISESLERISQALIDEQELAAVKSSLKGTLALSHDNVENLMQSNAVDEIYFKRTFSYEQICEEIDSIRPQDIRRVARKVFFFRPPSLLVLGQAPTPLLKKRFRPEFPKKFQVK